MRNKDHPTPNVSGGKMMGFALNVGSSLVLGGGVSNNQHFLFTGQYSLIQT